MPSATSSSRRTGRTRPTYQNQKIGYGFTREYAIALNSRGQRQQAEDVLQGGLRALPQEERSEADHFRLLLGLVAGAGSGVGRHELFELLSSGSDPDRQRIALELLVRGSPAGAPRSELGERLDRLIGEPKAHPILESLLLCRAQLLLGEAHSGLAESGPLYSRAEDDAHALLEKFPGSPLKAQAYAVLAGSAWEQQRYRTAADYAFKAGAGLPPGPVRADFDVLVAEAWFRAGLHGNDAGDFRSAADAYATAESSRPEGVRPGLLMFQRVQSEIEAGALPAAVSVLDELSRDPAFDPEDRWEAEWNLARSLEVHGQTAEAYEPREPAPRGAAAGGPRRGPAGEDGLAPGAPLLRRRKARGDAEARRLPCVGVPGALRRRSRPRSRARGPSCAPRRSSSSGATPPPRRPSRACGPTSRARSPPSTRTSSRPTGWPSRTRWSTPSGS